MKEDDRIGPGFSSKKYIIAIDDAQTQQRISVQRCKWPKVHPRMTL
jgi:hypothetical protein